MQKVKVLFFSADPVNERPHGVPLEIPGELRRIRAEVAKSTHPDCLYFDVHGAATADDFLDYLEQTDARVVHFSGHGGRRGLRFVGEDGLSAHRVDPEALAQVFRQYNGPVRLVVLAACSSQTVAQAIADIAGCTIGTTAPLSDHAAAIFSSRFYRAIASGESVRAASDKGRAALQMHGIPKSEYPEIFVGGDVDAAKLVLVEPPVPDQPPRPVLPPVRPRRVRLLGTLAAAGVAAGAVVTALLAAQPPVPLELTASDVACGSVAAGTRQGVPGAGATSLMPAALAGPAKHVADAKALYHSRNYTAAAAAFQQGVAADDGEAMGCLGYMYLNGRGVDSQPEIGFKLVHEGALKERNPHAMYVLGNAYWAGQGTEAREHLARRWFENAALLHHAESMRSLGNLSAQTMTAAGYREALAWYHKAREAGSTEAMVDLGAMYAFGRGVPRDPALALKWYRTAANAGSRQGMLAVGRSCRDGLGTARDYAEAMKWYRRAAELGSAEAMNSIGALYDGGLGVRKSNRAAVRWYRRAEQAGSAVAQGNLARLGRD